jgi:hypothetical protein
LVAGAAALCAPVLAPLDAWGTRDWDQHYFYYGALRASVVEHGQFPGWNPWYCGGAPLHANPQSALLSPTFLFVLVFGVPVGLKLAILAHAVAGAIGGYLLCRACGAARAGAALGGFVFIGSSVFALHIGTGHSTWLAMAYLPWALLGWTRARAGWARAPTGTTAPLGATLAGAVALALMVLHGSAYLFFYTALALGAWAGVDAIATRSARPLVVAAAMGAAAVLLGAVKLWPMFELVAGGGDLGDDSSSSLAMVAAALFSRAQGLSAHAFAGQAWQWWEYGAYLGVPVVALAVVGAVARGRSLWPLALLAGLFLWLAAGPAWGAFAVVDGLPGADQLRVPSRLIVVTVCLAGVLAAVGWTVAAAWSEARWGRRARWASRAVAVGIALDLWIVGRPALAAAFPFAPPRLQPAASFAQARGELGFYGPVYTDMYRHLLENRGFLNCYERFHPIIRALAPGDAGYRGEAYLETGPGTARVEELSPNRVVVAYAAPAGGVVVVNQNAAPGWQVGPGRVVHHGGLLAAAVDAGAGRLVFSYQVPALRTGATISLGSAAAWAVAAGALVWARRRRRRSGSRSVGG